MSPSNKHSTAALGQILEGPIVRRKTSFSNLFKRVQELYQSSDVNSLTQDEFCKDVVFQFGVPLLIIDLFENLTGSKIIPRLRE